MKRRMPYLVLLLALGLSGWSCSDKGRIFNAIENGEELKEGTSVTFLLDQNYPNPFNPSTRIEFSVAEPVRLRLQVFTDDWEEVATLLDRRLEVGRYAVQFVAEDLPSGEYYYTMTGRGITQVRKMKVVK